MSHQPQISVVVLGSGDSLKKALITVILGKDLSQVHKRSILTKTKLYKNDIYEVVCTPDLSTSCGDIEELFAIHRHPDMCLLVVENDFSPAVVWDQIENLHMKTGISTEEFTVVLPLGYKHDDHPFKSCTMEQVFSELRKLAEERRQMSTNRRERHAEHDQSTSHMKEKTGNLTGTEVNLVLLGLAGTGKSATGNTILKHESFVSRSSSNPVTTKCQVAETVIDGAHVRVIDTPDIFDDEIKPSVKDKHVAQCKELCQSGPCVYLLVMQVGRFTDGEKDILEKLEATFRRRVREQTVVLFTGGEELQRADMSLEDFLTSCRPDLRTIIEKCGKRCVAFQNKSSRSDQVKELMYIVDRMVKEQRK